MIFKNLFFGLFRNKDLKGALEIEYKGLHRFGKGKAVKMKVLNGRFFRRVILHGDTGFGESYFLSEFQTDDLYGLLEWFIVNKDRLPVSHSPAFTIEWAKMIGQIDHYLNKNTKRGSKRNIKSHYDLSNRFYELWLDRTMTYSCAAFEGKMGLEEAQLNKYRLICESLDLNKKDHVLEIGTGWGGFAEYAKKHHGCKITTITISKKQYDYAKKRLPGADIRFCDYRDITGTYDKIVSIEMMEALGHDYVPLFIRRCDELLKDGGKMVFQMITIPDSHFRRYLKNPGFIKKHIFPGGELLSLGQVTQELERNGLMVVGSREIGDSYVKTLLAWRKNVMGKEREIKALGFDIQFLRKWDYYLTSCAVGFDTKYIGDVQLCIKKSGNKEKKRRP